MHDGLMEPHLKPARTTRSPWWNPGGTLVEPSSNQPGPPAALEKIGGNPFENLVESSWNLTSNHPAALAEPGGTVVEPWWNSDKILMKSSRGTTPQTTPDHPAALVDGGTLVEPYPGGTLVEPWWNPGAALVEPWWNPGGTLVEPWLRVARTTPEPIWAKTPKLSAVGEKGVMTTC